MASSDPHETQIQDHKLVNNPSGRSPLQRTIPIFRAKETNKGQKLSKTSPQTVLTVHAIVPRAGPNSPPGGIQYSGESRNEGKKKMNAREYYISRQTGRQPSTPSLPFPEEGTGEVGDTSRGRCLPGESLLSNPPGHGTIMAPRTSRVPFSGRDPGFEGGERCGVPRQPGSHRCCVSTNNEARC
jgi:hypothetical protein